MKYTLYFLISLVLLQTKAQDVFELKSVGFSMLSPKGWIKLENETLINNLNLYDFNEEQKNRLLLSSIEAVDLVTFSKYHPTKFKGIIPTIKVRSRKIEVDQLSVFLQYVEASNIEASKTLQNFTYKSKPEIVMLSNKKVIRFTSTFILPGKGVNYPIISYSYYILKEGYYLSVNFIEEENKENNQAIFEQLINSIKLN